jgi:hypothetical protein
MSERCREQYFGVYKGLVRDVEDPKQIKRIMAEVPSLSPTPFGWCLPIQAAGDFDIPPVGSPVTILFQGGEARLPMWLPGWVTESEIDPLSVLDYPSNRDTDNGVRIIRHGSHVILIGATEGNKYILLGDDTLQNFVRIQGGSDASISIQTEGHLNIKSSNPLTVQSPGSENTSEGNESRVATGSQKIGAGELLELVGASEIQMSSNGNIRVSTNTISNIDIHIGTTDADSSGLSVTPQELKLYHLIKNHMTSIANLIEGTATNEIKAPSNTLEGTATNEIKAPSNKIEGTATNEIKAPSNTLEGTATNEIKAPSNKIEGTVQNEITSLVNKLSADVANEIDGTLNFIGTTQGNVSEPMVKGTTLGTFLISLVNALTIAGTPISSAPGAPCLVNPALPALIANMIAQLGGGIGAVFNSTKNFTG